MDNSYAAGIFDGEGCVMISKRIEQRVLGEYRRYQVRTQLTSINPVVPYLFKEAYGGSVHYVDLKSAKNPNWRPQYDWIAVSRVASNFLRQILPHLLMKNEEAELALALEDSIQAHKYNLRKFPERQSVLNYRDKLREDMMLLKKRAYPLLDQAPTS